jgi:hypothetical protein
VDLSVPKVFVPLQVFSLFGYILLRIADGPLGGLVFPG